MTNLIGLVTMDSFLHLQKNRPMSQFVGILWSLCVFPGQAQHITCHCELPAYISQLLRFHEKRQYLRQNTGKRWDRNGQNVEVICHGYLSEGLLKNGQNFMAIHGDLTSHAETPRSESNPGRHWPREAAGPNEFDLERKLDKRIQKGTYRTYRSEYKSIRSTSWNIVQ